MDARTTYEKADSIQVIDVREPHEWQAGHLPGAKHIPMGEIPARISELDRSKPLVAVCRSGSRSEQVTRYLRAQGFEVDNLDGGMKAWKRSGLPVAAPDGRPGKVV